MNTKKIIVALIAALVVLTCGVAMAQELPNGMTNCEEVEGFAHVWSEPVLSQEATCVTPAQYVSLCQVKGCNAKEYHFEGDVVAHTWKVWTVVEEATCDGTKTGVEQSVCEVCGKVGKRAASDYAHNWTEWRTVIEPTCTEIGQEARYCTICKAEEKNELKALGHNSDVAKTTTEPCCLATGLEEYYCSRCGIKNNPTKYPNGKTLPMLNHVLDHFIVAVEPTCTVDGTNRAVCVACFQEVTKDSTPNGAKLTKDQIAALTIKALGHNYVVVNAGIVKPTCVSNGKVPYECNRKGCDAEYTEIIPMDAKYHVLKESVLLQPTATEMGLKHIWCEVEGCNYFTEVRFAAEVAPETPVAPETSPEVKPEEPETKPEVKPEATKPSTSGNHSKPSTNESGVTIPATGDTTSTMPYIVMALAAAALVVLAVSKRKVNG